MLTILIVDDDEQVRTDAMRALASSEIRLASAADGKLALEQAALLQPDIVICDVDMPGVNGFDVLAALKADETLASAQVMMLTAQGSRDSMRLGMALGADDYLTKPFTEAELVDAVGGLIKRRDRLEVIKNTAARDQEDTLRTLFASGISGDERPLLPAAQAPASDQVLEEAAVLFSDIRNFTSMAEKLPSQDVARLLAEYFERTCEPVLAYGGQYLKLLGDGLIAVFPEGDGRADAPLRRALLAATEMADITHDLGAWLTQTFPDARLAPFRVGFGVHCGQVEITRAGSSRNKVATPVGDTVNMASRLERAGKDLGWSIVASSSALARLGEDARVGAVTTITMPDCATPFKVSEVLGLRGRPSHTPAAPLQATVALHDAGATRTQRMRLDADAAARLKADAHEHAVMAARAVKQALADRLSSLRRGEFTETASPPRLHGFSILRRLGAGGMSAIYLARREETQDLVVLKVMPIDPQAGELTARFMREFALLSTLKHPGIVRIFNQGFSGDTAYIAMEYFENGDLRSRMKGPLPPLYVITVLEQTAAALGAIHRLGIVHRDLKPENLMVRANGDVVLADFGIAKLTGASHAGQHTLTVTGELIGSPSYMSPEQVSGGPVTSRSDLYALGVMLYEMATGNRPYTGLSLIEVLGQHARAPTPRLPEPLQALQPVLDRLMAKKPAARYADADELLAELQPLRSRFQADAAGA
jgi:serine/threonine-protein kinase PpkA